MLVFGFDPGLKGGMCALDEDGRVVLLEPMPAVAGATSAALLTEMVIGSAALALDPQPRLAIVEDVHAMPKQGVSSTFKFGRGLGVIEGVLAALGIPAQFVRPQTWQKTICEGTTAGAEPKARALLAAQRLYPHVDLVRGTQHDARPQARKPHDGLVDALLLARYGWLQRGR